MDFSQFDLTDPFVRRALAETLAEDNGLDYQDEYIRKALNDEIAAAAQAKPIDGERNFFGDTVSRLARGGVQLADTAIHAVDTAVGGSETLQGWSDSLDKAKQNVGLLRPDKSEHEEGWLKRSYGQALESAPMSAVPWAGAMAGASMGAVAGPAGAVAGGLIGGTLAMGGLFGLGTYGQRKEEVERELTATRPDLTPDEISKMAHDNAKNHAFAETGGESAGDLASWAILSKVPGGQAIFKGGKAILAELAKPNAFKAIALGVGKAMPFEVGSEVGTAIWQNEADKAIGVEQGTSTDAALAAIGPAMFLSAGMGVAVGGYSANQRRVQYNALNSEDQQARAQAVDQVAGTLAEATDQQTAKKWRDIALGFVQNGQPIPLDMNLAELSANEPEVAAPEAQDQPAETILKAESVDEAIQEAEAEIAKPGWLAPTAPDLEESAWLQQGVAAKAYNQRRNELGATPVSRAGLLGQAMEPLQVAAPADPLTELLSTISTADQPTLLQMADGLPGLVEGSPELAPYQRQLSEAISKRQRILWEESNVGRGKVSGYQEGVAEVQPGQPAGGGVLGAGGGINGAGVRVSGGSGGTAGEFEQASPLLTAARQHVAETGDTTMGGLMKALDVDIDTAEKLLEQVRATTPLPRNIGGTQAATVGADTGGFLNDQAIRKAGATSPATTAGDAQGFLADQGIRKAMGAATAAPVADTEGFVRDQQIRREAMGRVDKPTRAADEPARAFLARKREWEKSEVGAARNLETKEIAGMTTDELEAEDKRLQTLIAESPHFKGKGRMPTPEEVDRAQDIVSEIFSRRRGKDEIENERWFERKESASAYLERYGYAKQRDGRFAAGKEKPYAEIEDIESFQGGHKVKLTEFSADIEDKLHAVAEANNATYDRAKRLYQEAIARDGINEANHLLNVSVPNARRKKGASVSQTGENETRAELPRTDETQAGGQGGGQGKYDYDLSVVWRGRAPQVAAPTVLKSTTGGKEYAIPGLEELRVTVKPPSGNKAKHTKLGWSVYVGDNLIWANLPGVADTAENAINSARGKLKRIHAAIAKDQAQTTPKTTSTSDLPGAGTETAPSPGEASNAPAAQPSASKATPEKPAGVATSGQRQEQAKLLTKAQFNDEAQQYANFGKYSDAVASDESPSGIALRQDIRAAIEAYRDDFREKARQVENKLRKWFDIPEGDIKDEIDKAVIALLNGDSAAGGGHLHIDGGKLFTGRGTRAKQSAKKIANANGTSVVFGYTDNAVAGAKVDDGDFIIELPFDMSDYGKGDGRRIPFLLSSNFRLSGDWAYTPKQPWATRGKPPLIGEYSDFMPKQEQAAKEPWQMTREEYLADALERNEYRDQYKATPKLLPPFEENTEREWRRSVEKAAETNRIPDAVLDSYLEKFGKQVFSSTFRGVAEKGARGYFYPEIRAEQKAAPADKKTAIYDLKPHERTWAQQRWEERKAVGRMLTKAEWKELREQHKSAVQKALRNGEKVPASVLADYPELADAKPRKDADMADVAETDFGEKPRVHSYSNTQVRVTGEAARMLVAMGREIPEGELYIDPNDPSYGRETEPHITVRYGLAIDDAAPLAELSGVGPMTATLGKVSIFAGDKYDVVKVDVISPDLHKANKKVGNLVDVPGETFKDYKPHATIAYVKPGEGQKYVGRSDLEGVALDFYEIDLVNRNGETKTISLQQPAHPAQAEAASGEWGGEDGIVEHTTKRGKVLRGRIVTGISYRQAKEADPYTFKKDGGFFIREGAGELKKDDDPAEAKETAPEKAEAQPKENLAIKRLRISAERLKTAGEAKLNQDRNANTARRARMANNAEADARANIRTAETLLNIVNAQEDGTAGALAGLTSKAQLETLQGILTQAKYAEERKKENGKHDHERPANKDDIKSAVYLYPHFYDYKDLDALIDLLGNKKGWRTRRNDLRRGGLVVNGKERIEMLREALKLAGDDYRFRTVGEQLKGYDRLQKAGITDDLALREALERLVELSGKAPEKNRAQELERALVGQNNGIDFFPTPKAQAKFIVDRAGIEPGMRVLEPSAGTGNLAEEMRAQGGEVEVAEISPAHREVLEAKGFKIVEHDFMDMEEGGYDVIVMNPPFSNNMDIDHVRKAYELLKPGGRVVAIMGEGAFFRTGKKETDFREWLDEVGINEKLPEGFFTDKKELRTTGVNARVVEIDKPIGAETPVFDEKQEAVEAEQADTTEAPIVEPEAIPEQRLLDTGFLREFRDRWQYKLAGNNGWFTADRKEDAVERARKAYEKTPEPERLTAQERFDKSTAKQNADIERLYGDNSLPELRKEYARMEREIASLQKAGRREFDGNGGRRTGAAVSNEGARNIGEQKLKLGRYIEDREKAEKESTHTRLHTVSGYPSDNATKKHMLEAIAEARKELPEPNPKDGFSTAERIDWPKQTTVRRRKTLVLPGRFLLRGDTYGKWRLLKDRNNIKAEEHGPKFDSLQAAKLWAEYYLLGKTEPSGPPHVFRGKNKEYEYTIPNSAYALDNFEKKVKGSSGVKFAKALPPSSRADIQGELTQAFGKLRARVLMRKITVLESQEEAKTLVARLKGATAKHSKDGAIQGIYANGKTYLVADGIAKNQAVPVLLHELGEHAAQLGFAGDREYQGILRSLEKRAEAQNATGKAIRAAMARVPEDTLPEHYWSEVAAYLVENKANGEIGIVKRILNFFKRWLYKAGAINADRLTPEDLVLFARSATLAHTGATYGEGVRQSVRDLFKPVDTESAAFLRWFGDSKVVDADGKPLVVYHGTRREFESFEPNKPMSAYGNPKGMYFTSDKHYAEEYASDDNGETDSRSRVIPVYLRIEDDSDGIIKKTPYNSYEYIVFNPENIKSAEENTGAFSPTDPRIRHSKRFEADEADERNPPPLEGTTAEDPYEQAAKIERNKYLALRRSTSASLKSIAGGVDKYLGAISTRLRNISPKLEHKIRQLDFNIGTNHTRDVRAVEPLLKLAKQKMSKMDFIIWDLARKNSDVKRIDDLAKKYGIRKEYDAYRKVLDRVFKEAQEVGIELGWINEYAPRVIKDPQGFLNELGRGNDWPVLTQKLKEVARRMDITVADMTPEMKADIISDMLFSGYYGMGAPGSTKERSIAMIPPNLNQYYMDSDAALMQYLHSMRKHIEARRFFGKVPQKISEAKRNMHAAMKRLREEEAKEIPNQARMEMWRGSIAGYRGVLEKYKNQRDYTDNIAQYVIDLMESGELSPENENVLKDILNARFNEHGTRGVIQAYKNFSYLDTMGSPISAITQIGDLAWSIYANGWTRTLRGISKSALGKAKITKEDVGIERIAQEFADTDTLSKAVAKVFRWIGLEKMDTIGKESFLNGAFERFVAEAKKDPKALERKLEQTFEEDAALVVDDLQNERITENVKLLVYSDLLNFQPAAMSEMPEQYLLAGNGRLFYMLKTYTLKQFDVFRREGYNAIRSGTKAEKIDAVRKVAYLAMLLVLANGAADELKDWLLGRKTDLSDRVTDNVLRLFGVSKYMTWKARTEGYGSAIVRQILPPFKFVDSLSKDILSAGDGKGLQTPQSVPLVGKLAYWHLGRGKDAHRDLWEIRFSKERRRLEELKERVEENPDLASKYRQEMRRLKAFRRAQYRINQMKSASNKLRQTERRTGSDYSDRIDAVEQRRIAAIKRFLGAQQ